MKVMSTCVRWYVAYPLSLRNIEEMMRERGVFVDHATVHRWAIKMVPVLAAVFRRRKHPRWQELANGLNPYQSGQPIEVTLPGC
jgi:transposase-like protein